MKYEINKMYNSLINSKSKSANLLDKIFFEMIEQSNINCFIEAGAFDAQTSLKVNNIKNCEVFAFEANPYNFNNFKSNFLNTDINYLNFAVSDKEEELIFFVQTTVDGHQVSSIKKNNSLKIKTNKNITYERHQVQCVSINGFFKETTKNFALWIDVEGLAYEVLLGATKILKNTSFLKIEVEQKEIWKGQKTAEDVVSLMDTCGFIPLLRDYEYTTQYNIIFVPKKMHSYYETIVSQVLNIK